MADKKSFDPYPYILVAELVILLIYLFGGLLFLTLGLKSMTFAETYTFLIAWFSLFLSITCITFLIIITYREVHILIQKNCAEMIGEKDDE